MKTQKELLLGGTSNDDPGGTPLGILEHKLEQEDPRRTSVEIPGELLRKIYRKLLIVFSGELREKCQKEL